MKHVVTLTNNKNGRKTIKVVVEAASADVNVKIEGYHQTDIKTINPLQLHMFFGTISVRALSGGVEKALKEVAKGNGVTSVLTFDTEAEKNAYVKGLEDSSGWEFYESIEECYLEEYVPEMIEEFNTFFEKQKTSNPSNK